MLSVKRHVTLSFLIVLLSVLHSGAAINEVYDHTVYVDSSNPNATDSSGCGLYDGPCLTVSFALSNRVLNSTQVVLLSSGNYTLSGPITLTNYIHIGLTASSGDGLIDDGVVTVTCESGAGLSFVNCTNVALHNVELFNCGALQNSTSRNFSDPDFSFMQFPVALYFLFCQEIDLTSVRVTSSRGTGVAVYATAGHNRIHNCTFFNNSSPDNATVPSGGGLYIEFPFCDPRIPADCQSGNLTIAQHYFTEVEYDISECVFKKNRGHMWNPVEYLYLLPQYSNHLTFGSGGGLSVFFSQATYSTVRVTRSVFDSNAAEWGGGVFVEFQYLSRNNSFTMDSCVVSQNTAITNITISKTTGGGGLKIGYHFINDSRTGSNHVQFSNCTFQNNTAYWGGGILLSAARERSRLESTNTLLFYNCSWLYNQARVGSALDLSVWAPFLPGVGIQPTFTGCVFRRNNDLWSSNSLLGGTTGPGVGTVNTQSIPLYFEDTVLFESNNCSALAIVDTSVDFLENCFANFTGNNGRSGGAISLFGSAFMRVHPHTNMNFIENTASQYGGAIFYYTIGQHKIARFGNCFIQFSDPLAQPWDWTASFLFKNNTAKYSDAGNSIYATSLVPCLWSYYTFTSTKEIPDARKEVFCWNSTKQWKYEGSNCTTEISSDPAMFNMTQNDSRYHMEVILGKRQLMPVEVLGDKRKNHTANGVFNLWSHSPEVAHIPNAYTYVSDNTIELHGMPNSTGLVALETINPRVLYTEILVEILPCPPGFSFQNKQCICSPRYGEVVQCNQADFSVKLLRGLWMGEDTLSGEVVVGISPYTGIARKELYLYLPNRTSTLNQLLCGHVNRKGVFCGECYDGYAPTVYTFSCVKCSHKEAKYHWIYYILAKILPITLFFFMVVFFHISVTRGSANGFVFFAQLLTTTFDIDGDRTIPVRNITSISTATLQAVYKIPYDIWNLNFFSSVLPDYCLGPNLDTLSVISLNYILAVYPLVLILVFYCIVWLYEHGIQPVFCICKPVHRILRSFQRRWNLNRSTIDAFSTFLVLSYTKFTVVSVYLLTPTTLHESTGPVRGLGLYYQGGVRYLSKEHAPFFAMAVFVMVTFVLLPPVLLLVYPLKLLEKVTTKLGYCGQFFQPGSRMQLFLDTFQGCFKDGTNGTRDFRYFAGLYFVLRTVLFTSYAYSGLWFQQYIVQQLVCTIGILLFAIVRPYKKNFYNNLDALLLGILAMINTLSIFNIFFAELGLPLPKWGFAIQYVLIFCPLIYMTCYVVWRVARNNKRSLQRCLERCRRSGLSEASVLLPAVAQGTADETSERPQLSSISVDDEYRQFADEVEAFGRDRERNRYRPKRTNSTADSVDFSLNRESNPPSLDQPSSTSGGASEGTTNETSGASSGARGASGGTNETTEKSWRSREESEPDSN